MAGGGRIKAPATGAQSHHAESHQAPTPGPESHHAESYHIETLGCPKNQVDSDKLEGTLAAAGLERTTADTADVVVVNTCAFIEEARRESVDAILAAAEAKRPSARLW